MRTGTKYYLGNDFLKPGMKLTLEKESDNKYDREAILVKLKEIEIGHVANSTNTVIGECMSAGKIYDKITDVFHKSVKLRNYGELFPVSGNVWKNTGIL